MVETVHSGESGKRGGERLSPPVALRKQEKLLSVRYFRLLEVRVRLQPEFCAGPFADVKNPVACTWEMGDRNAGRTLGCLVLPFAVDEKNKTSFSTRRRYRGIPIGCSRFQNTP